MIEFVKRHPLISTQFATLLVLMSEFAFFGLAQLLGRSGAAKVQPFALRVIALFAVLWFLTVRFCFGRPGRADALWGIVGFIPAALLGIFTLPEFACNAGHGCM